MTTDALVGCIVAAGALALTTVLVWWSRRTINHIAESKSRSAREILRERRGGR